MEEKFYPIGTKVRFASTQTANIYPKIGTVGVIKGYLPGDPSGAWISWPEGSVSYHGSHTYCSFCFLELAETAENKTETETEKENTEMENSEVKTCSCCGCIIEGEGNVVASGDIVCDDCLESEYAFCEECEEYVPFDEIQEIDGSYVCESCLEYHDDRYFRCDDCGEWFRIERWNYRYSGGSSPRIETCNGDNICIGCYENSYATCEDCGEVDHVDNMVFDDDCYYCESCSSRKRVHNYSYKPAPKFKTGNSIHDVFYNAIDVKEPVFGVELEIDDGDDAQDVAFDLTNASEDIYCKHDGSLEEEGVEIVTHPCTLSYHQNFLGWDRLCQIARNHNYLSHNARTCGLHVHVGRQQFGETWEERDAVAAKLVILVNRHWDNIVKFSRRKEYQLDDWAKKPDFEVGETEEECIENALALKSNGRYQAVNQCNSNTIEFRVFNGTLRYETILATLEFVSNLVRYAMSHSVEEVMGSQWDDIINVERYSELMEYLEARNIVAEKIAKMQFERQWHPTPGDVVKITNYTVFDKGLRFAIGAEATVVDYNHSRKELLLYFPESQPWMHTENCRFSKSQFYWAKRPNVEFVRSLNDDELMEFNNAIKELSTPSWVF